MAGALMLGWLVGYERYFSGQASGSQVYCLVCATSCAVTLLAGYPALWYWSTSHDNGGGDPTRVIGAILTYPIVAAVAAVIYVDLRGRKENVGAHDLTGAGEPPPQPSSATLPDIGLS